MEFTPYFNSPQSCDKPYSVSDINRGVSELLSYHGAVVWVEGEISGLKRAASGHCYLRLKDNSAQIPAVIWNSYRENITVPLKDGEMVGVIAALRVYEQGGYYQLDIRKVIPQGVGAMAQELEALKEKLLAEGIFAEERKRPLPSSIKKVGVVTAKTGAALHDIISVIQRNAPHVDIVLSSALVQGSTAPESLVKALSILNSQDDIDVIIFGRGGGSKEDLFCFNDEAVVRAIFQSSVPVISAVGHEVDTTLSDFVADLRAATPSAAAEIVAQGSMIQKSRVEDLFQRFIMLSKARIGGKFQSFQSHLTPYLFQHVINRVADGRILVDAQTERFEREFAHRLNKKREVLAHGAEQLELLSPLALLKRGYAVVQKGDKQIHNSSELKVGDDITIRLGQGEVEATIINSQE